MELSDVYKKIKTSYETQTGETISDDGDFGMRMQVVAGEMAGLYQQADFVLQQMLPQTATGTYLERHAAIRGIERKQASAAAGTVTFSADGAAAQDVEIPEGTMCTSSLGNGIVYATTEAVVLPQGQTSVDAPVAATVTGKETNLAAGGIDTLVSGISGIRSVTNAEPFSGGCEMEEDNHLRQRLLISYLRPMNGANLRFYEELALTVSGVWSAKAVYSTTTENQLIVYISNFFRNTPQSLCDEVAAVLQEARELNIEVVVKAATPTVQAITAKIYVENLQAATTQRGMAETYLANRSYLLGIGEDFNPYTFASGLSEELEGFCDLVFSKPAMLVSVSDDKIFKPGVVSVTLEKK